MGDTNVEAYESTTEGLRGCIVKTSALALEGDGLGLLERQMKKLTPKKEIFVVRAVSDSICSNDTAFAL